jgi:hypothetical protein
LLHQQSVFPIREAPRLLDALLTDCRDMGEPPCLASIKLFGSRRPVGLLSFPREGFTIALDFANRGETTRRLLRRLEARVLEAGGAIYPAKDSTLSPGGFDEVSQHGKVLFRISIRTSRPASGVVSLESNRGADLLLSLPTIFAVPLL